MPRDRYFSCTEAAQDIPVKGAKNSSRPKRLVFKPFMRYLKTANKEESMIKARYDYVRIDKMLDKVSNSNIEKEVIDQKEKSLNDKKRKRESENRKSEVKVVLPNHATIA